MATVKEFNPKTFVTDDLNLYTEKSKREFCMTLMDMYVPSKVDEDSFLAISQGRAEAVKKEKGFFSTCGELAMFELHQMGYRGPILNRTLTKDRDGVSRRYKWGANMARLLGTAKKNGNFVQFKNGNTPNPGDICFVSNGPPRSEHVFIFARQHIKDGALYWESYDAGQTFGGKKWNQCAKIKMRKVVGTKVGGKTCHGWVDISSLPLVQPATLESLYAKK